MPGELAERFIEVTPTPANTLRGIVLFGRNVASYKFALAQSLLEVRRDGQEVVSLDQLAVPFSRHLCDHLLASPRQGTSGRSRFLDACRQFNDGQLSAEGLIDATTRLGFVNVIDAFHVVGGGKTVTRFFIDERRTGTRGIRLTDELLALDEAAATQAVAETEARWRLVETAWSLDLSSSLIAYDEVGGTLLTAVRRKPVTSARDALNGYQKGRCFYCYRPIATTPGSPDLADVDHLFPHALQRAGIATNLDQVWNLVLACQTCNRGLGGKFDAVPDVPYLERLESRNEYLISSHHPLRETLIAQTGGAPGDRHAFLQEMLTRTTENGAARWSTVARADPTF